MTSIINWLKYNFSYIGSPPWDTHVSPPELIQFIQYHPPGKALDLGCGSGTNSLTLARAGWDVCGVDFSLIAVKSARSKVRNLKEKVIIRLGDVTNLALIQGSYHLILDIGCFHNLPGGQKEKYSRNLNHLLLRDGTLLMYAHLRTGKNSTKGIIESDIHRIHQVVPLIDRSDSMDRKGHPSSWLIFSRAINEKPPFKIPAGESEIIL